MSTFKPQSKRRAYTLVEVLIVVAIIGLAGAVIVPHMLQAGTMGIQAAGRIIIADLLYAQNEAIAQQRPRRLEFDVTNNRYHLADESGNVISSAVAGGAAGSYVMDFNADGRFAGVTITGASFNNTNTIEFDILGSPSSGGTIDLVTSNQHYRITVAAMTGRVTIAPVP